MLEMKRGGRTRVQTETVEFIALPFSSSKKKKRKIWSFHVEVVQGQRIVQKASCTCRIVVLLTKTIISFWHCRCLRRRSFVTSLISLSKTREVVGSLSKHVFWATHANHVNQKWGLFPFNMPQGYQIWIAKAINSYKDDLLEVLGQNTAQECSKYTSGWRA